MHVGLRSDGPPDYLGRAGLGQFPRIGGGNGPQRLDSLAGPIALREPGRRAQRSESLEGQGIG
ncbi:MAG: hypothetical protein CBC48_19500 [bacterium TMED88]|nr:MAG: hypothetical protein CBC48_19500 [bacterium TMED88]